MDPDNQPKYPSAPQQPVVVNKPIRLTSILMISVVSFVMLGVGLGAGYILFANKIVTVQNTQKKQVSPIIENAPTSVLSPTVINDLKTYTSKQLQGNSIKPYTIQYPAPWEIKTERDEGMDLLTLTKNNYSLIIYQAAYGGGGCIFEGNVPEGPYEDLRNKKFIEIKTQAETLRRFEATFQSKPTSTKIAFCASRDGTNYTTCQVPIFLNKYSLPKRNLTGAVFNFV